MKNKRFYIGLIIAAILYTIVFIASYYSSCYIRDNFSNPPVIKDYLWEKLPEYKLDGISEVFIILSLLGFIIWAFKKNKNYIPYALILFAVFQIIRAGLVILTPLELPYEYNGMMHIGEATSMNFGVFPSGHLAYPVIAYLIIGGWFQLVISILTGIALLISRGHYSIDLVGTILLSFFIYTLANKYIKPWFIEDGTVSNSNNPK